MSQDVVDLEQPSHSRPGSGTAVLDDSRPPHVDQAWRWAPPMRNAWSAAEALAGSHAAVPHPRRDLPAARPDAPRRSHSRSADGRLFPHWCGVYAFALITVDFAVGAVHGALALAWAGGALVPIVVMGICTGAMWVSAIALARGYNRTRLGVGSDELHAVLRAAIGALVLLAFMIAAVAAESLEILVLMVPSLLALGVLGRFALRKALHRRRDDGRGMRRVVLVGDPNSVASLAQRFTGQHHFGMRPVAAIVPADTDARPLESTRLPVVVGTDRVAAIARDFEADAVAVAGGCPPGFLRALGWALEGSRVELLVDPGLMEVAGPRLHVRRFEGLPLLYVEEPRFTGSARITKAIADRVLTAVLLTVASPLLLAIAVAIKIDDGGPVFFRQRRVGRHGKEFSIWKFRSMSPDAEQRLASLLAANEGCGPLFKMRDDPRLTRVGAFIRRYSLDELPQLFNVLIGHMSLVGPRPPLPSEVEQYEFSTRRRLLVTPGITGLWQVSGRSDLSWDESIRLDLRYVENWSITADLLILWKTLFAVLGRRGAY